MDQETIRPKDGEFLTAHEALELTYRFREALDHDIFFTQTLLRYLTWEDLAVFETFIGLSFALRSDVMSDNEREQHRYIKSVASHILKAGAQTIMTMTPVEKVKRLLKIKTSRGIKDSARKW